MLQASLASANIDRQYKHRNGLSADIGSSRRPPVAGVPAAVIVGVEPDVVWSHAIVTARPGLEVTAGAIARNGSGVGQEAAVNAHPVCRNVDFVPSDRGHGLEEQLSAAGTEAVRKITAAHTDVDRPRRSACRDQHAALDAVKRQRPERVNPDRGAT